MNAAPMIWFLTGFLAAATPSAIFIHYHRGRLADLERRLKAAWQGRLE